LDKTPSEVGNVVRIAPQRAWIRLARKEACSSCKGCALGEGGQYMITEAQDPLGVSIGDEVRIGPARALGAQRAALLLFGIPILLLFAGYAAGQAAARALALNGLKELPGLVAGFLAMAIGYIGLYLASRRRKGGYGIFVVMEVIHKENHPKLALREEDTKMLSPAAEG